MAEDKGRLVIAFLESFFSRYVEYDFTASLEEQLDRVSNNEVDWRALMRDFWAGFIGNVDDIKDLRIGQVLDALDTVLAPHVFPARADGGDPRQCPTCGTGRLSIKLGKFGAFVGCSNYPECRFTRQFAVSGDGDAAANGGTRVLGKDPESGLEVSLRAGRFGPYLQLGEGAEGEKPKRSSIPKGQSPSDIDLERALALLSLPRQVGKHPETGEPIMAGIGRFGPYVQHQKTYASLEAGDDVLNVGLNRAVTLIAEKALKGGRGRRGGGDPGRSLGDHPSGGAVVVKNGRYGAYVSHDGVNATLPRDKAPDAITLEEALALIEERIAKGGGKRPDRKAAKTAKSKSKPKAATPKSTAKPKTAAKTKSKTSAKKAKSKKSEPPPSKAATN
jgi:DNA topoisomerase-1